MPLYCHDDEPAEFPTWAPMPVVKLGQVRPREHVDRDRCARPECQRVAWQHRTVQR